MVRMHTTHALPYQVHKRLYFQQYFKDGCVISGGMMEHRSRGSEHTLFFWLMVRYKLGTIGKKEQKVPKLTYLPQTAA